MSLSKDGKTPLPERVRRPAICALLSLREVGGYKRAPNRALRSNIDRSILSNLNAEDYAFTLSS